MKDFNQFTNLYSLSKTLKFELKPIGKTLDYITEKSLLNEDEQRAESYKRVKKIIDEYHKKFIDSCLRGVKIGNLQEFESLYFSSNKDEKELTSLQKKMRKEIADRFTKTDA